MKILWLAHEANLSGANICLLEYIVILKDLGIESQLVCPHGGGSLVLRANEMGIPVTIVKYYSWTRPVNTKPEGMSSRFRRRVRNYIAVKKLSSLIKKNQPDFVVTNTIVTSVGAIAAKITHKKHIWFVHEFGEEDHGFMIAGGFTKGAGIMNRLSIKLVFNSIAVRKKYNAFVSDEKAFIVNNAVVMPEAPILPFLKDYPINLILLGQVAPAKHHMEALIALKICNDKGLKFKLNIVGKAEDRKYLEQLNNYIDSENLKEFVNFNGPCHDPVAVLAQHHALLMCSHNEAFGRVTIEALKCGLPVIAANTGGSLEIIEDGKNGYFYEAGNAADLAGKIMFLYDNYYLFRREDLKIQTKKRYNISNTGSQLMNVFR